ncbi:hypothetical protein [Streptomyces erythrochromogenes]|uniref:hypothetical protein n=1 Tax=Streptomyces erythrochromogenes TaxID=285574 RepID=UPI003699C58D
MGRRGAGSSGGSKDTPTAETTSGSLLAPVGTSRPGPERAPPLLLLSDVLDLTSGHPA